MRGSDSGLSDTPPSRPRGARALLQGSCLLRDSAIQPSLATKHSQSLAIIPAPEKWRRADNLSRLRRAPRQSVGVGL